MARRKPPKISANAPIWGICRKSQDAEDRQIHSLEDQENEIKEKYLQCFSVEERLQHPLKIIKTAQSGFVPGLPTIREVCAAASRGNVYGALAVTVNRLGRNHTDLGLFVQDVADGFIPFFETTEGRRYTGKDASDIFMLAMEGVRGWQDSAEKSKTVYGRMMLRAKEGKHMGRKMFGLKPHNIVLGSGEVLRHTVVDDERFPHLLTIFRMAAAGSTYPDIVRWAKKNGIKQRHGTPLTVTTISGIIKNPYYKGATRYDGVHEDSHEPLIDPALWEAAQTAVQRRRTNSGRKKQQDLRQLFVFGDTVHCGKCNGTMSAYRVVKKKTGKTYIFYECKNRRTKCGQIIKQERSGVSDPVSGLREQFDDMMTRLDMSGDLLNDVRGKLVTLHKEKSAARHEEVSRLQSEYLAVEAELTQQVAALAKAKELGVEDIVSSEIRKLVSKRQHIKNRLDTAHDEGTDWINKTIANFNLLELVQEAIKNGSPVVRESVIRALCSNLTVTDKKLVPEPRSPFKQALKREGDEEWWSLGDSNS